MLKSSTLKNLYEKLKSLKKINETTRDDLHFFDGLKKVKTSLMDTSNYYQFHLNFVFGNCQLVLQILYKHYSQVLYPQN